MIPIQDSTPQRHFPLMNYALVGLCTAAFVWEVMAGPLLEERIDQYALIPARFLALGDRVGYWLPEIYAPFLTSTFLHGGPLHFGMNMLFLWIFGGNVEDRLGHVGYLGFYLLGGVFAGAAHVAAHPESVVPTIGASGAIAAVMGAYLLLYPRAWIVSFIPPFFWLQFRVPALLYLALWFAMQIYMGNRALADDPTAGGTAWWAHAGGFVFGAAAVLWIGRHPKGRRA